MANFTLNPYLHFNGNAEEVLNFYKSVFGGETTISRYGDMPNPDLAEEHKNLVMHGDLQADPVRIMVSDSGPMGEGVIGTNFSMSLSGPDESLRTYYEKLSEGGQIQVPLAPSQWGDEFAMFTDKYGISWFVNITKS